MLVTRNPLAIPGNSQKFQSKEEEIHKRNKGGSLRFLFRRCNLLPPQGPERHTHTHTCAALCNHGGPADEASPEENPEEKRKEQKAATDQETHRRRRHRYVLQRWSFAVDVDRFLFFSYFLGWWQTLHARLTASLARNGEGF